MIGLITTILEAAITIFSFLSKRAKDKDELKDIRDEFSKKHDEQVQENIRLRKDYEEIKKSIKEKGHT